MEMLIGSEYVIVGGQGYTAQTHFTATNSTASTTLPSEALQAEKHSVLLSPEDGSAACRLFHIHLDARAHNVARSGMAAIAVARPRKLRKDRVQRALKVVVLRVQIEETPDHFRGAPQRRRRVR
jgi:hypothetical protein